MKRLSTSIKLYFAVVVLLSTLMALNTFLPQSGSSLSGQEIPMPDSIIALANAGTAIVLYGGLGYIGLKLSQKFGFPNLWDESVSNKQRLLLPALVGSSIGLFFIGADMIFSKLHNLGPLPHPLFPISLVVSATAGIGEEIIFRLFLISFWVWLISHVIFKNRWQKQVFWIVAIFSALAFALGHLPSVMTAFGITQFDEIPLVLLMEVILLNGVLSIFAAQYFRKYGFLAAVGIHFWTDVVWHVIWGNFV